MNWWTQQDNDDAWQQAQREEAERAAKEDQEKEFIKAMMKITALKHLREEQDAS